MLAAVIGAAVYCYINYTKLAEKHAMIYANYSGISLIGEEDVLRDPYKLADSIFEEAKKMWEGEQRHSYKSNLKCNIHP